MKVSKTLDRGSIPRAPAKLKRYILYLIICYYFYVKHHLIYIPGIGDHRSYGQNIAIQLWRLLGIRPHYLPLRWNKKEGYSEKEQRLLTLVEKLKNQNSKIAIIGVSAGASVALNALLKTDSISSVICICGKINNPQTISKKTFTVNPDFKTSMTNLTEVLPKLSNEKLRSILSIHPWRDQTVPLADTYIEGASNKTLPGWSHATGIFFGVICGIIPIAKFIRR
jgi:pimeloyl-ACP methyl ester carboxylesterase